MKNQIFLNTKKLLKVARKVNGVEVKANGKCHGLRPLKTLIRERKILEKLGNKILFSYDLQKKYKYVPLIYFPANLKMAREWGVVEEQSLIII